MWGFGRPERASIRNAVQVFAVDLLSQSFIID
jgi:hypothetical protein